MLLGESIYTYDIGLALRGSSGKFHVTTPKGEELVVTCTPTQGFTNIEWANPEYNNKPFLITKVTEPAQIAEVPTMTRKTG